MQHFETFLKVVESLEREGVQYILIGGYAVIIHGFNRFTQDMDICVQIENDNINALRAALDNVFHDESLQEISAEEIEQYPVIRYGSPDGFLVDIIGKMGSAYRYDDLEYDTVVVEGRSIRVATPETLYRMKISTVRPKDHQDAEFLKQLIESRKRLEK